MKATTKWNKNNKIYIFITTYLFLNLINFTNSISVLTPESNRDKDVAITGPSLIQTKESNLFETIMLINEYLWFSIGLICMVFLIIGGFKLMGAGGQEEELKKANNFLKGAIIGIFIAILSYAAIRLIVNVL